jgi:succinate dehydrogenase/fumarate reductase flavoprotein subunit
LLDACVIQEGPLFVLAMLCLTNNTQSLLATVEIERNGGHSVRVVTAHIVDNPIVSITNSKNAVFAMNGFGQIFKVST